MANSGLYALRHVPLYDGLKARVQEKNVKVIIRLRILNRKAYLTLMDHQHTDAAAVDRVGTRAICDHFEITRQAVRHWRREGVPRQHRKSLVMLGESLGHDMTDLKSPAQQA